MIDNYKTNQPIVMIWGQCTCLKASFSSRIRFSGFRDHKYFFNWYRDDLSNVECLQLWINVLSSYRNSFGEKFAIFFKNNEKYSYFSKNAFHKKVDFQSKRYKIFCKIKVVEQGRFRGDANWNFWKIFKNEKVMNKKRNSVKFGKSCLHQWKIV